MKKRYIYSLLFLAPGALFSLVAAAAMTGTAAGFLWIFVLGDSSWPTIAERGLALLFPLAFLALWVAFIMAGFITGKRLEAEPGLNKKHLFASIALTIAPLLFILLQQYRVGNIGSKPDSVLCGEFCSDKGYSISGMPPGDSGDRSCICYDDNGSEIMKRPLENLLSNSSQ